MTSADDENTPAQPTSELGQDDGGDLDIPEGKFIFLKLTQLRKDKGLSKAALATRAKVGVGTVGNAEKRIGNRYETLRRIFNALDAEDLYNGALVAQDHIRPLKR